MSECKYCGEILEGRQKSYCSRSCKQLSYQVRKRREFKDKTGLSLQSAKGVRRKLELVSRLGGGCSKCGYNKNLSALEFHHLDPSTKSIELDNRTLSNSSIETIEKELLKCILICSNCHSELHNPKLDIKELNSVG